MSQSGGTWGLGSRSPDSKLEVLCLQTGYISGSEHLHGNGLIRLCFLHALNPLTMHARAAGKELWQGGPTLIFTEHPACARYCASTSASYYLRKPHHRGESIVSYVTDEDAEF